MTKKPTTQTYRCNVCGLIRTGGMALPTRHLHPTQQVFCGGMLRPVTWKKERR